VWTFINFWIIITIWICINIKKFFILTTKIRHRFRTIRWFKIIIIFSLGFLLVKRNLIIFLLFKFTALGIFEKMRFLIWVINISWAAHLRRFLKRIIWFSSFNMLQWHILLLQIAIVLFLILEIVGSLIYH
jgi:hypothetical protein